MRIDNALASLIFEDDHTRMMFDAHCRRWTRCKGCGLSRKIKIFSRGTLPCEVLLIGEAPGPEEHKSGWPFVGRAGVVLQEAIRRVEDEFNFTYAIANACLCFPPEMRTPTKREVNACSNRLTDFLTIALPRSIVFMGNTAKQTSTSIMESITDDDGEEQGILMFSARHPAFICRRGGINSAEFERFVLVLTAAVEAVLEN